MATPSSKKKSTGAKKASRKVFPKAAASRATPARKRTARVSAKGRSPLASWNDTATKSAMLDFVARVTKKGSNYFVPPAARIAVFDNDGTLWCEKPMPIQTGFLFGKIGEQAAKDPSLRDKQPWKAAHEGDFAWLGKHFVPDITAHANSHWTGYLLLAIYAASQVASTLLMPSTMDKTQRRIMMFLPIVFITFVAQFPMGLIIYWMTTNLWTVGQGLVTRRLVPRPATATGSATSAPAGPKRSSRTPPKAEPAGNGAAADKSRPSPATQAQTRRVKKKKGGARR